MKCSEMMKVVVLCGASALSVVAVAQDMSGSQSGTTSTQSSGMGTGMASAKDKTFLMKAAQGGMAEVKLGQLAADKGGSADVKSFGQKMVDDHTKLNEQMMPIAQRMGVTPPTSLNAKDQALYDKLNGMSGASFDRAYIKAMQEDHAKDLKEFTAEMNSTKDPELKTAVTQGRDVIQQHKTMVDSMGKGKSGSGM